MSEAWQRKRPSWFRLTISCSRVRWTTSTRRRKSLFSNTLVLPGFNLYEALKIDDPKKLAWKEHLFDLRGRHLEKAVFDGADLTKADLTRRSHACNSGASLDRRSFRARRSMGRSFRARRSMRRSFRARRSMSAQLQGASLDGAQLQGASL